MPDDVLVYARENLKNYLDLDKHPTDELVDIHSWKMLTWTSKRRKTSWFERFKSIVLFHKNTGNFPIKCHQWLNFQIGSFEKLCYLQKKLLCSQPGLMEFASRRGRRSTGIALIGTKGPKYEDWQIQRYWDRFQKRPSLDDDNPAVRALARWDKKRKVIL